jgi:tetratricopeptide (TPR) repeat protein
MRDFILRRIVPPAVAIVLLGISAWWILRPRPTLAEVDALTASGHFEAAEAQVRDYLRAFPGDERARLMLARISVDRPDPRPGLALEQIRDLRPADPHRAALVKAIEGDALFWERRFDAAEPAWLEALRLEPAIPEVGWKLLNIYALQGRDEDSSRLALRLFGSEPDPHDRVQLLLQLLRHDAHPIEAGTIIHELEPVVRANPGDLRSTLALGRALVRSGRAEDGLDLLRRAVGSHGDDLETWAAYLDGLIETGGTEGLVQALGSIPGSLAGSPRFDIARGWLAAQRRDLDEAARAYRLALEARPSDPALAYRLRSVLRQAGRGPELAELEARLDTIASFPARARDLYDRINLLPDLGRKSRPEFFGEVAATLGQIGRREEADAWGRLARIHDRGSP